MATTPTTNGGLQPSGVPQNNDSTTVQQQNQGSLPSPDSSKDLQPNSGDVNSLKTNELAVKSGPKDATGSKHVSGTMLSIVLVGVILVAAAALFIASFRVSDENKTKEAKPAVAIGAETEGALGKVANKSKKKSKKSKKAKK